jgi:UDP-glucose:(heptosyl)LPS alpha-1,3-glucosyltransferase
LGEEFEEVKFVFVKKRFSIHGGAERYLQTLIECLKRSGHEIHIFSNYWTKDGEVIFHKVNVLPFGSLLSTLTFNLNVKKALESAFKTDCKISFERTTYQDIYRAGEGCHREWLKLRKLIEPSWRQYTFRINPLHIALLSLEKKLFYNTKIIIANSHMVKKQIIKHYGLPENKIHVVYNGVDLRRFSPQNRLNYRDLVRKDLSIPEEAKVILFVGSGFERKGLLTLLKALSILKTAKALSPAEIYLVVIGKGDIKKFKHLAQEYGLEGHVAFIGQEESVEKFYGSADVFVLPTVYDPFSNATLEAMASGLPVVTTDHNGASEIIEDGIDGFILRDLLNYNELAEKIMLVLSDNERMGINARQKAEMYPIQKSAEEFMDALIRFAGTSDGNLPGDG